MLALLYRNQCIIHNMTGRVVAMVISRLQEKSCIDLYNARIFEKKRSKIK